MNRERGSELRWIVAQALVFLLSGGSFVWAQEAVLVSHKPYLGDGSLDHDYFDQSPYVRVLLRGVEANHLNGCPHNRNGVMGDIAEGRYSLATEDIKYALRRFPNHPKALQVMELLGGLTRNPSLPIVYYKKALDEFPQYGITYAQYGAYLVKNGQVNSGVEMLRRAIELDPNQLFAHVWLAKAYYRAGKRELGDQVANQAKELGYKGDIAAEAKAE